VIEHHVADVRNVHTFTEGTGRNHNGQIAITESPFDGMTSGSTETPVVERDAHREIGDPLAKHSR